MAFFLFFATNNAASQQIEEVLVTGTKRTENLQDVPIAISTVHGDAIRESGISQMEELTSTLPNIHVSEGTGRDNLFIRGIGSGSNLGFEMAVGQVIDGFFYGRGRFSRSSFLDTERVEILKGPQGALIGKNTTAGVINIISEQPEDRLSGWLSTSFQFEGGNGFSTEGVITGPLSETFSARLALRKENKHGYITNLATQNTEPDARDHSIKASALWTPTESTDITFSYQNGSSEHHGRTRQLTQCGTTLLAILPNFECSQDLQSNVLGTRNGEGDYRDINTEFDMAGMTINWQIGDHIVTSLSGWSGYDINDQFDSDLTPIEAVNVDIFENYKQLSEELRITSPSGNKLEYIAGIYLLHNEIDMDFKVHFAPPAAGPFSATRNMLYLQESDTVALFGQATWNINKDFAVTAGLRYTQESKDASHQQFATTLYTQTPAFPPVGPAAGEHDIQSSRSEDNISPTMNLSWTPKEDSLYYMSLARGFKGGGFNGQVSGTNEVALNSFEFKKEEVTAFELGTKQQFLEKSLQLNIALFHNSYNDLQVTTLQPDVSFSVGNASSAITQGLEIDLKWRTNDQLTLGAAIDFLDAHFEDFSGSECYHLQTAEQGCDSITNSQNLSNKTLQFSPDMAATLSGEYSWTLTPGLELIAYSQVVYSDDYLLQFDQDPLEIQQSFYKIDARLTLADTTGHWQLSLVGKNLTNELTATAGNDLALNNAALGIDFGHARFIAAPRTLFVKGTYFFQP